MLGFLFGIIIGLILTIILIGIYIYLKRSNLLALSYSFVNDRKCPVDISKKIFGCQYNDILLNPNINFGKPDALNISYFLCGLVGKLSYLKDITSNSFVNNNYAYKSILDINLIEKQTPDNTIFGKVFSLKKNGENNIFVIFRGTHTLDEWKKDFNYYQSNSRLENTITNTFKKAVNNPQVSQSLYNSDNSSVLSDNILIHSGFLDIYNSIKDVLYTVIEKNIEMDNEETNIIISGHSLGAGIATIANYDLKQKFLNSQPVITSLDNPSEEKVNIYSITFASPRVGNNSFRDSFNSICTHYNWINTSDVIPTLPLSVSPNFKDYKSPFIFTHVGKIIEFTSNWESLINNHMIPNYIENIKNY